MVKNPDRNKEPITWGYLSGHIWKRIWKTSVFTYAVGFLRPTHGFITKTQKENYEKYY